MTTVRTCTDCRTRFELAPGKDRETCRRCAGLVCPGCGGPTSERAYCSRPGCQAVARDHDEALEEKVEREREVPRLVRRAG